MTLLTTQSSLDIAEKVQFDNGIVSVKIHDHYPYAASGLNKNDEIRIGIDQRNVYTFPADSYLHITANVNLEANHYTFDYNGLCGLFNDVSIYLNGQLIENVQHVQLAANIRSILLRTPENDLWYKQYGFSKGEITHNPYFDNYQDGKLNIALPLHTIFGFIADFRKPILNARMELVLKRATDNKNVFYLHTPYANAADVQYPEIQINSISWRIPYIQVNEQVRIWYLNSLKNDTALNIPFRQWDIYENPAVPQNTEFIWNIKMVNTNDRLETIAIFFQTNQKQNWGDSLETMKNCDVRDVKAYLDSDYYPYESYNAEFKNNNFSYFYEDFIKFEPTYNKSCRSNWFLTPKYTKDEFKLKYPIFVINLQYREQNLKTGGVSALKVIVTTNSPIPANTSAYAVLIYGKNYTYKPLSEEITRIF